MALYLSSFKRLLSTQPRVLSPAVLWRVQAYNLSPTDIPATGPKRHILKGDILSYLQSKPSPTSPQPSISSLLIDDVNGVKEFVKMVDPGGIEEIVLVQAIRRTASRCMGPELVAILQDKDGKSRSVVIGEAASSRTIPVKPPSMRIVVGNTNRMEADDLFTVRINNTGNQYQFEFSNPKQIDMNRFIELLSENVRDPYLMLL